jgi:hypothetical protein
MAKSKWEKRRARELQELTGLSYQPAPLIIRDHAHEPSDRSAHVELDRRLAPLAAAELSRQRGTRLFPDDKHCRFDTLFALPFPTDHTQVYRDLTLQAAPVGWRPIGEPVTGVTVYRAHAPAAVSIANATTVVADMALDAAFIAVLASTGDVAAFRLDAIVDRGQAAA